MTTMKSLRAKRANAKGKLTQFVTFVDELQDDQLDQLPDRIENAAKLFDSFDEVQRLIEELKFEELDGKEPPPEVQNELIFERKTFEDRYFASIAKARRRLRDQNQPVLQDNAAVQRPQNDPAQPAINVKLPTLQLPKFDGNYNQWLLFKDTFLSVIDSNVALSNIQKFQYLRSSLKGEALNVIQTLETTEANYEVAWNLITARYENKKLIINIHLKNLFELQPITKSSHTSLRLFVDSVRTNLKALESLGEDVENWDTILIYLISGKLDYVTRRDWELHAGKENPNELPNMNQLFEFLTNRAHTLELVEGSKEKRDDKSNNPRKSERKVNLAATTPPVSCIYCENSHSIYKCEEFTKLPVEQRKQEMQKRRLCLNCLRRGHYAQECRASFCKRCSERHNTLLHVDKTDKKPISNAESDSQQPGTSKTVMMSNVVPKSNENCEQEDDDLTAITFVSQQRLSTVFLATVQVYVHDSDNRLIKCRAMLDTASQANLITTDLVKKMGITMKKNNVPLSGVGKTKANTDRMTFVKIKSMHSNFTTMLECQVMPVITEKLPQVRLDIATWNIPSDINLADPAFNIPGNIDLLIGAALFWQLLCMEQIILHKKLPTLQKTVFGWVVGGELFGQKTSEQPRTCHLLTKLNKQIEKFWKIEEIAEKQHFSSKDQYCEEYFQKTVQRNNDGRYVVRLPRIEGKKLGTSEEFALRRLFSMENRIEKQPNLRKDYNQFMREYENLGHMSPIEKTGDDQDKEIFYVPHQPVVRNDSLTTKLRVVFDASARTSNGVSLNDILLSGPNLQGDLWSIVLRFRCYQYVVTTDIAMMFRQVLVSKEDRDLQRIVWRENSNQIVHSYTLNTVTYGTACAPFLAMRCLKHLAEDEEAIDYPNAASALKHDLYMDDILTGSNTISEAAALQQQLTALLVKGQFPLRKWRSNEPQVLQALSEDRKTDELLVLDKEEPLKTLGLLWNSNQDVLQYEVKVTKEERSSKRKILSEIAKIYDPLGLIGPILITAKIIMQELWKLKLHWDDEVPENVSNTWSNYYEELPKLNDLKIPRNMNPSNESEKIDIHGFGDASEKAYGACVYCTYKTEQGQSKSALICSKSRVAPLKTISLPKLELCAALLLAKLTSNVIKALHGRVRRVNLWSDSTIVLCWIKTAPYELKTFYANRVSEIQQLLPQADWNHVESEQNPADLLSRGMRVCDFLTCQLWWCGPTWITSETQWPKQRIKPIEIDSAKKTKVSCFVGNNQHDLLQKYSKFSKLQRVVAYCLRFKNNLKNNRQISALSVEELEKAKITVIRMVQEERFSQEYADLRKKETVNDKSPLKQLHPFIDSDGLIRVGGRLRHADIPESQRHPILLPSRHHLTTIILRDLHISLKHCGPKQLLCIARLEYWPLSGGREAKKITHACVRCFRAKPIIPDTMMADLPKSRVKMASRPFDICGVDYAGPIMVRESRRRGKIPVTKAYIAVFVCFTTKAIHLELVSSLDTEHFMAALRRFTARRGTSSHIYSDNGTNFVGASNELKAIYEFLQKEEENIATNLAMQQISWHFTPPHSPHFGGLWEAGVKSVKKHLNKIGARAHVHVRRVLYPARRN